MENEILNIIGAANESLMANDRMAAGVGLPYTDYTACWPTGFCCCFVFLVTFLICMLIVSHVMLVSMRNAYLSIAKTQRLVRANVKIKKNRPDARSQFDEIRS